MFAKMSFKLFDIIAIDMMNCEHTESRHFFSVLVLITYVIRSTRLVWCPGKNKRIEPHSFFHGCRKATKGLTALTPEIDCD
jgi:hypothetical protein